VAEAVKKKVTEEGALETPTKTGRRPDCEPRYFDLAAPALGLVADVAVLLVHARHLRTSDKSPSAPAFQWDSFPSPARIPAGLSDLFALFARPTVCSGEQSSKLQLKT
jgi:hypothetical protein